MTYQFNDEDRKTGLIGDGCHFVVVYSGHPRWQEFLAGNPTPAPVETGPTPEDLRASMPIITARQLRLALLHQLDEVESLIAESNDRALQIEWEYATTFERLHPAIVSIGAALGLTEEEIDTLWLDAANT